MPRSASQQTIARQWAILKRFSEARQGLAASDVHRHLADAGYQVSRRTVERDLNELSAMFPLVSTESVPQAWRLLGSARAKGVLSVDPVEGLCLVLAGEVLESILPAPVFREIEWRFEAARRLLADLKNNRMAHWSQVIRYLPQGMPLKAPGIDSGLLEAVQTALVNGRRLVSRYRSAYGNEAKDLVLHPLAIVVRGKTPYLVASIGGNTTPFFYAMHRFESATMGEDRAELPRDFNLDEFLRDGGASFGAGGRIRIEAEIREALPDLLRETPLSDDQRITEKDGRWVLNATVRESWELEFWILSQAHRITVVKPAGLRRKVRDQLHQALSNYNES